MMTYYYIWNKMLGLKGQIYALEAKSKDGSISKRQIEELILLEIEHRHWEKVQSIWDQHGDRAFDGYELKPEFVDEQSQIEKTS